MTFCALTLPVHDPSLACYTRPEGADMKKYIVTYHAPGNLMEQVADMSPEEITDKLNEINNLYCGVYIFVVSS